MMLDQLYSKGFIDEQPGKHEKRGAGNIEQRTHGVGEDVIESMPPAI